MTIIENNTIAALFKVNRKSKFISYMLIKNIFYLHFVAYVTGCQGYLLMEIEG